MTKSPVCGCDYIPGRMPRAGPLQCLSANRAKFVVLLVKLPIGFRHTPCRAFLGCKLFEPFSLLTLGNMQPKLEQQYAFVREHPLEFDNPRQIPLEPSRIAAVHHIVDDGPSVPCLIYTSDAADER